VAALSSNSDRSLSSNSEVTCGTQQEICVGQLPSDVVSAFAALGFLLALFVLSHRLLLLLRVLKFGLLLFLGRLFRLLLAVWTHENLGRGRRRKRRTQEQHQDNRNNSFHRFPENSSDLTPAASPTAFWVHRRPLPRSLERTHVRSDIAKMADQPALG